MRWQLLSAVLLLASVVFMVSNLFDMAALVSRPLLCVHRCASEEESRPGVLAEPATFLAACDISPALSTPKIVAKVNDPFVIRLDSRDGRWQPKTRGGDVYYVRAIGPSIVMANNTDFRNGSYEFDMRFPLPGVYKVQVTLLFTATDAGRTWWEASPEAATHVLTLAHAMASCNDAFGNHSKPQREVSMQWYWDCMNYWREAVRAPQFMGATVTYQSVFVNPLARPVPNPTAFCGVDVESSLKGHWYDVSQLCSLDDIPCRQQYLYCAREAYVDPRDLACNSSLVWRPDNCRHYAWSSRATRHLPEVKYPLTLHKALSTPPVLFAGDSTTHELFLGYTALEPHFAQSVLKRHFDTADFLSFLNSKAFDPHGLVILGRCGLPTSGALSVHSVSSILANCTPEVPQVCKRLSHFILRLAPAAHPSLPIPDPNVLFHGVRGWLQLPQIEAFNRGFLERYKQEPSCAGKYRIFDEYAMTLPLYGRQLDALHWMPKTTGPNAVFWNIIHQLVATMLTV